MHQAFKRFAKRNTKTSVFETARATRFFGFEGISFSDIKRNKLCKQSKNRRKSGEKDDKSGEILIESGEKDDKSGEILIESGEI